MDVKHCGVEDFYKDLIEVLGPNVRVIKRVFTVSAAWLSNLHRDTACAPVDSRSSSVSSSCNQTQRHSPRPGGLAVIKRVIKR